VAQGQFFFGQAKNTLVVRAAVVKPRGYGFDAFPGIGAPYSGNSTHVD
jgi:hypothetical protein